MSAELTNSPPMNSPEVQKIAAAKELREIARWFREREDDTHTATTLCRIATLLESRQEDAARHRFAMAHAHYYSIGVFLIDWKMTGKAGADYEKTIDAANAARKEQS